MELTTTISIAANTLPILCSSTSAQVCDDEGVLLGQLTANPYIANPTANKFGSFGRPFSPTSINYPYSQNGSSYSPISPNNPHATKAPILCGDDE